MSTERDREVIWKLGRIRDKLVNRRDHVMVSGDMEHLSRSYERLLAESEIWNRIGKLVLEAESAQGPKDLYLKISEASTLVKRVLSKENA